MESNEKKNQLGLWRWKQTFHILMSESLWMAGKNIASEGKNSDPGCFLDVCWN